ncbi:MAG TPA: helix-turn-helix domain-containing protein [Candidatus Eremiobacteraceae bacterium]
MSRNTRANIRTNIRTMMLPTGDTMEAAGRPHFGALLRQFRLDAGLTQQDLAERAKLSVEAVSLLERGARTRPRRETVILLGRALALPPERQALLGSAIGIAHPTRQRERSEALHASLLTIVRPDAQAAPGHNLPHQLTSFVGRQREVNEIGALVREHRLVTLVGSGGVGKTRVAVQVGSDSLGGCPDGVWLVDLAPLPDQSLVASAVLTTLQLPSATGSAVDTVVAYLKTRRALLILDNCEHVIAKTRELAAGILESCPHVHILSTSREALDVAGERTYYLPSLEVPPESLRSAKEALPYGGIALFVDRALAVDASFVLTDENVRDVAEICRRLDGIPLAIELAAARVKTLAPHQIVLLLDQRFRLLTGGDRRALPRHQTMTALIDWSYDLLTPRERLFFESLSVFAGSFTLEAATSLCATSGEGDIEVIDLVASLVTKSLLLAELVGTEQRYRLLESSRQYAREKLTARGEHEQLARHHALVYLELAQQLERAPDTMPHRVWSAQANVELENWRAALDWSLGKRHDVAVGQRLAAAHRVIWRTFPLVEGRRWVRAALDLVDELTPPDLVARLEHAEAEGAQQFGERKVSLAAAERALARYRELGDILGIAQTECLMCASLVLLGRTSEAEPLLRSALEAARMIGARRLTANVLMTMGWSRCAVGDFAGARVRLTEALGLAKVLGDDVFAASVTASLAENEFGADDPETAIQLAIDVLELLRATNSLTAAPGMAATLTNMATYLVASGRYDEAQVRADEALEVARGLKLSALASLSLRVLALVAMLKPHVEGRPTSAEYAGAARLFGFLGARLSMVEPEKYDLQREHDRALLVLRGAIGSDALTQLMGAGATMTEDEAIHQARAIL